ncbi:M1 family metallopeptidase [Ilumatobacter coccineus]|uniref:Aminopeptidase N n=1 Tax=Ilumatobacter coccineus (strain NBRC 103263 / KCTC 29153 / YM16-304) TaxID=1313172 RepID=A0A6C7EFL7_ILUCY|nr:M1 family metallopeptidase [Ilumatobacter coccineus]BAN02766.1 peptidase M01 family protein [Ilumatobacter coccineus YM16-304]
MATLTPPRVLLAAAVVLAACSSVPVETERADVAVGPVPTIPGPPATSTESADTETTASAPPDTPATTDTAPTTDTAVPDPERTREPDLGVGDDLFPDLGSSDVDVQSYLVRLTVDPSRDEIDGIVTIEAEIADDIAVMPLDQIGLDVDQVAVDGDEAEFELTDTELLVELPPDVASVVTVRIEYSFVPNGATSAVGLPSGWFVNAATDDSYVLNEPDGARSWMPSNDHPSDKAKWTFEVTVPPGTTAAANGELIARTSVDGDDVWIWAEFEPMPTYLVQLIVGSYEVVVADPVELASGREVPLTHVVPAGERTVFEAAFESIGPQMDFFEARFGPYPLERYGLAFVNDLSGLAMETQGRSMFGADDFAPEAPEFLQELLLSHELAHQWFGNAVSPATWGDIWLNESLATYAQWLWLDEAGLQPLDDFAAEMLARRQVDGESTGDPSVSELFGFLRYDGGAPIVHALRLTMGDDPFFELLSDWVADNADTSRTTDDFIDLATEVHRSDLTAFFDAWLFAGDLPDEYPS